MDCQTVYLFYSWELGYCLKVPTKVIFVTSLPLCLYIHSPWVMSGPVGGLPTKKKKEKKKSTSEGISYRHGFCEHVLASKGIYFILLCWNSFKI